MTRNRKLMGANAWEGFEHLTPNITLDTIDSYIIDGWHPGGFVVAVLCNDLLGAAHKADSGNYMALGNIAMYINKHVPDIAQHSSTAIMDWVSDKGSRRTNYVKKLEADRIVDILTGENG